MKLLERACPLCSVADFDVILDLLVDDFAPLNPTYSLDEIAVMGFAGSQRFGIVKCRRCSFVYSRHALNDELTRHLYSKVISVEKALTYRQQKVKLWQQLPLLHLLFSLADKQSTTTGICFLDFGCGWGEILQIAHACGAQCFGVEIEPQRAQFLREKGFVVKKTLGELADQAPFDLVYCNQVLEHVPNPSQVLEAIASVTKPGGYGFFAVPDFSERRMKKICYDFDSGKGLPTKEVNPWEHLNYFSPTTFRDMLERYGFKVVAPSGALPRTVFIRNWADFHRLIRNIFSALSFGLLWRHTHSTSLIVQRLTWDNQETNAKGQRNYSYLPAS